MFRNPVIPGFAPDPSVVQVDGIFYLATSSFHFFPGIPIYASVDLQKWIHIGNAINRLSQLSLRNATTAAMPLDDGNVMVASGGLFAPTICHNDGTFYIVCTNCYHGKDNWRTDNFIISTKDIWSNTWSDPINFSFYGIDPSLFFDDDGRAYIQGSWMIDRMKQPSCVIKQVEIDLTTGKPLSDTRKIWGGFAKRDTEGPHIYKRDGWYYLLVAEGGTFEHHMLSIGRSKDIWGPYESCPSNPIMTSDGTKEYIQNIGHGELFQDTNENWWAAVLGVRYNNGKQPMGRESFLTPVEWPKDGWPTIQQPRMSFDAGRPPMKGLAESSATFLKKLRSVPAHLDDLYLHEPLDYDLYTSPTSIALLPTKNSLSDTSGTAMLARRQRSLDSVATTFVVLPTDQNNARLTNAGLTVYKDPLRHANIAINLTTRIISIHFVDMSKDYEFTTSYPHPVATSSSAVELRIVACPERYRFEFRPEGAVEWVRLGEADGGMLTARDFTGTVFGVYAVCEGGEGGGDRVRFEGFEVKDVEGGFVVEGKL